jgi:hypothetical protein
MGFFRNRNTLPAASVTPTIYSVSDNIVEFTQAPTPHSRSSQSHAHSIRTPTLPTSTLLTVTYSQVLWFLSRLTSPRASGVTTGPASRLATSVTFFTLSLDLAFFYSHKKINILTGPAHLGPNGSARRQDSEPRDPQLSPVTSVAAVNFIHPGTIVANIDCIKYTRRDCP